MGQKLGGILTETKLAHFAAASAELYTGDKPLPCIKQAVVGVGINWHNPTPETGVSFVKVLESLPGSLAKIKINCLEMLGALVLRGILQGVFFQKRVGSQVFMKEYEKLLTQFKKPVSLDRKLLDRMVFSAGLLDCETNLSHTSLLKEHLLSQLLNRSGEVVGVSEEGYLKVALRGTPIDPIEWPSGGGCIVGMAESTLLFAPSAIDF